MVDLRDRLIEGHRCGAFLQSVFEAECVNRESSVVETLVALHNDGSIDVIKEFKGLRNSEQTGGRFFRTRRVFEESLPSLNAPVRNTMECVAILLKEAGQDMTATTIFAPFIEFCAADGARPDEALSIIKDAPGTWANFTCPVLLAGAKVDFSRHFHTAIDLTSSESTQLRAGAILALGRFQFPENSPATKEAVKRLQAVTQEEVNDQHLGHTITSILSIYRQDDCFHDETLSILNTALEKGKEYALHAASEEFGLHSEQLNSQMIMAIIQHLSRVNPSHKATIDNIDLGIASLIKDEDLWIPFVENLLIKHRGAIAIECFDSTVHRIIKSGTPLLNKLLTRWFLRGDRVLCDSIRAMLSKIHGHELQLQIDPIELPSSNPVILLFVARKAVGYLFFKPVTAASIVVSLIQVTGDVETANELASLLFDPLLLNYPGSVRDFLKLSLSSGSIKNGQGIQSALDDLDRYFDGLRSVGNLPEMHPSQYQREAYSRQFNQKMAESYKEAMKGSIIELICAKSVLLYGRKSINYVYGRSGETQRTEIPLECHSTELQYPRREQIDPFGLDYMLRVCRSERLVKS